ncbi:unnamed protein product [Clonostachys chloroleuca]|uniref:Heterokaryon incompatibility domain-containing protein n=1 Tax=Clonostachys chloroleuca TaxID=1926264 RepID=A0AA35MBU6_9HYPO|nr:unnamed protein product [Clonostachys chloroleuca]
MANTKKCSASRAHPIQVHDHCPDRPYIELRIPSDAKSVEAVTFTAIAHDQGWASSENTVSFTWFEASVRRPGGRSNLRSMIIMHNQLADPEFHEQTSRWSAESGLLQRSWVQALEPGDVVQLIPKARYPCWVNIVKECRIGIEYEPASEEQRKRHPKPYPGAESYTYALSLTTKEIRLLTVQPATNITDKLDVSWSISNLDDKEIKFSALSYCWGAPLDTVEMMVSSDLEPEKKTTFDINPTVDLALRRLRRSDQVLHIWIDAICINQENYEERSRQVGLMRDIFSRAERVHIWLGEGHDGVDACLRIARNVYNYNLKDCPGGTDCNCDGTRHSLTFKDVDTLAESKRARGLLPTFHHMDEVFRLLEPSFPDNVADWAGGSKATSLATLMVGLISNPWFSRVWVVQEVLLSQQAFVHSSKEVIPWIELRQTSEWLEDPKFTHWHFDYHIQSHTAMPAIWKRLRTNKELPDILDVFLDGHDLRASDPRDKIFALLVFGNETHAVQNLDKLIRPDYNKSTEQVFADFSRWWIREKRSLDILSAIHSQQGRTWRQTLYESHGDDQLPHPSWALGSTGRSKWSKASLCAQFDFCATGKREADISLLEASDPLKLLLRGRRISRISCMGYIPIEDMYPYGEHPEQQSEAPSIIDRIFDPCGFTGFWGIEIIVHDAKDKLMRSRTEYRDHTNAHWAYCSRSKLPSLCPTEAGGFCSYETDKLPTCLEKSFFVTEDGMSGLCPWMAKEGDFIALLDGGKVPYLLRQVTGPNAGKEEVFQFVGECYVEGIMHGEYFEDRRDLDDSEVLAIV